MKKQNEYRVPHEGGYVECYGELREDSNFSVTCEDEEFDDIWCNGHPDGGEFTCWEDVVTCLQLEFESVIVEISAC